MNSPVLWIQGGEAGHSGTGLHLSGARFPTHRLLSQGVVFQRLGSDWNWFSGSLTAGSLGPPELLASVRAPHAKSVTPPRYIWRKL